MRLCWSDFQHDYDFAFAKIDVASSNPQVEIDFDYLPQPGEKVIACGYAGGRKTPTMISASVEDNGRQRGMATVDRAFIAGMSGGPAFNSKRRVIGIVVKGSQEDSYTKNGEYPPLSAIKEREPFSKLLKSARRNIDSIGK